MVRIAEAAGAVRKGPLAPGALLGLDQPPFSAVAGWPDDPSPKASRTLLGPWLTNVVISDNMPG